MEDHLKLYRENVTEYDTPKAIRKSHNNPNVLQDNDIKSVNGAEIKQSLTDKYVQLEDILNGRIYDLFNNDDFISLLEKYDVTNEKKSLMIMNDELLNNQAQKKNYERLVEIKKKYNELIKLFNELSDNEADKVILLDRIKQNDKKLLDSSLLNNHLISSDNIAGTFKSNDYFKLLLLDLRILKKRVCLNKDVLLEREMIADMLYRNRVHFFSIRMSELLERHIEDIDTLNKKDEDSFYLESVLRKKVNHIHIENTQLKEQINRDMFLINKKDQEISKLSFTLSELQDQLDNSINHIRMKLKNKYGNLIHLSENSTFEPANNEETLIYQNLFLNNQNYRNKLNIGELSENKDVLFINKEMNDHQNQHNSNMHAHIRRHNYLNNVLLKGGTKLSRKNDEQTEFADDSVVSGFEGRLCGLKSSIHSKLNILSQCKHVISVISTPREQMEHINSNNLIITPVDTDHELVENVESGGFQSELGISEHANDRSHEISQKDGVGNYVQPSSVEKITDEYKDNDHVNNNEHDNKVDFNFESRKTLGAEKTNRTNIRQNLSLQNYKTTDKNTSKALFDRKCIQENERLNGKVLPKLADHADLKVSRTNSKERTNDSQLGSFSKPTATSLSKKRTKSKERISDYNNTSSNNLFRSSSKTNLTPISHLKGGIFDDSYVHNESVISANILSKRNLRKTNNDLESIVPKTKTTNLVHNSTLNDSIKDDTIDKYLYTNKNNSNIIVTSDNSNSASDISIVKAYKATIKTIKSIEDFQVSNTDKDLSTANNSGASTTETNSFLVYSPEVKPSDLQPISFTNNNSMNSSDVALSRSNSTPIFNNYANSTNTQYYSFNLLNTRSSSNYFSHLSATQNKGNAIFSSNANTGPNANNIQYIPQVPTPINVDASQQRILFPNNFHALYK